MQHFVFIREVLGRVLLRAGVGVAWGEIIKNNKIRYLSAPWQLAKFSADFILPSCNAGGGQD